MFSIQYVAFINDTDWAHFLWRVTIGGEVFDYKTGIGHATPFYTGKYKDKRNAKPNRAVRADSDGQRWIHVPAESDVMECLKSDAQAASESFDSFCDNFGYSNDSLKALDTYRACADTAKRLLKALGYAKYIELLNSENAA